MILVLGLLGILACPILGPFAWIMGRKDLGRIKRGEVDLSARPTTQAGMVCGILGTLWFVVVVHCGILYLCGIYLSGSDSTENQGPRSDKERPGFRKRQERMMQVGYPSPVLLAGIDSPEIRMAGETKFAALTPVLGVSVDDRHRAYPLMALQGQTPRGRAGSVVNDLLGVVPITVTYDDDARRARVFTSDRRGQRIGLRLGGMAAGGEMAIMLNEKTYPQSAKAVPLKDHPFELQTWGEWREQHPESDIYVGEFPTPDLQQEATLIYMTEKEQAEAQRVLRERDRRTKRPLRPRPKSDEPDKSDRAGEKPAGSS